MKPTVIALITAQNMDQPEVQADLAMADLWELRYDTFAPGTDLKALVQDLRGRASKPLLLTVRMEGDGGLWPRERSAERLDLWAQALQLGVEWIDIETEVPEQLRQDLWELRKRLGAQTQILISHHDFKNAGGLEQLLARFHGMQSPYGDAYKMALTFADPAEERAMELFVGAQPEKLLSCFSMGALGQRSRLRMPYLGAPWTYGYVGDQPSAPGQLSVRFLREAYERGQQELDA